MNNFGYLKLLESLTLEEFLLMKGQPEYLEIISEINYLLISVLREDKVNNNVNVLERLILCNQCFGQN